MEGLIAAHSIPERNQWLLGVLSRYQRLLVPDTGGPVQFFPISLDRVVGRLYAATGDHESAVRRFETAIDFCVGAGYMPEAAWSYHDRLAHVLEAKLPLERSEIGRLLNEGIDIAERVGLAAVNIRLSNLLNQIGGMRTVDEPNSTRPDGLTDRELEVLELLSAGKSNREISDELFISQNTVKRHLANVFSKTGSSNRAQAAVYASEQAANRFHERPDGLTVREVEVLKELASGKSNREIATELFITENTVIRHVANIFSKIGATNRVEATAYALRRVLIDQN
ncbi:MAG: LuxR C-terminal-related transcriptional regulator [Chloroflexi bacterium]|nr:LuxR C-terminal-related transcriptional regulator [Chloroflexota bacterium]